MPKPILGPAPPSGPSGAVPSQAPPTLPPPPPRPIPAPLPPPPQVGFDVAHVVSWPSASRMHACQAVAPVHALPFKRHSTQGSKRLDPLHCNSRAPASCQGGTGADSGHGILWHFLSIMPPEVVMSLRRQCAQRRPQCRSTRTRCSPRPIRRPSPGPWLRHLSPLEGSPLRPACLVGCTCPFCNGRASVGPVSVNATIIRQMLLSCCLAAGTRNPFCIAQSCEQAMLALPAISRVAAFRQKVLEA